jgi:hypothetical protein
VLVRASYTEIIEPASELCMKGAIPEIQRNPALTEEKRAVKLAVNKGGTAESFGPLRIGGLFLLFKNSTKGRYYSV